MFPANLHNVHMGKKQTTVASNFNNLSDYGRDVRSWHYAECAGQEHLSGFRKQTSWNKREDYSPSSSSSGSAGNFPSIIKLNTAVLWTSILPLKTDKKFFLYCDRQKRALKTESLPWQSMKRKMTQHTSAAEAASTINTNINILCKSITHCIAIFKPLLFSV